MAKNKKKQQKKQNQKKQSAQFSANPVLKENADLVRRVYLRCQREVQKERAGSPQTREAMDLDNARMKRRIEATLASLDALKQRVSGICPDTPPVFALVEDWARVNGTPCTAYDLEEEFKAGTLGAAIWMLDRIKDNGKLYELAELLPERTDATDMPEVWDPCHSVEVLAGMLQIIQQRNADCSGLERQIQKETGLVKRRYMDLYTVEGSHKQDVLSRTLFETALSYIPEAAITKAVQSFTEKFWDFTVRYYRSRALLIQEEAQLHKDMEQFHNYAEATVASVTRTMNGIQRLPLAQDVLSPAAMPAFTADVPQLKPAAMQEIASASQYQSMLQTAAKLQAEEAELEARGEELQSREMGLWVDLRQYPIKPENWLTENYGEETAEIWDGFEIEDPYEICFAFLYLLDSGSDLPWLYFPSGTLLSMAMDALPWTRTRYNDEIEDIWYHFDPETGEICPGPGKTELPKRIRTPDLENWYRMQYMDKYEDDPEYQERYSLAQILYEITGCIMPRDPRRYYPALQELDRYGINGKKALHPLVYCMSLLGEARQQSKKFCELGWEPDEDDTVMPDDSEESVESLKAKIAALQSENSHLKQSAYETGRELREERKRNELLEEKAAYDRQELADLRELIFHQQENRYEDETPEESIAFPYQTIQRVVVFGGHDSWAREIKPRLPNVRFIDRDMLPNAELIRRADVVWIQANALSHAYFYKIIDEARKHNIPVRYFSYASAVKCAEQLAEQDMKEAQK